MNKYATYIQISTRKIFVLILYFFAFRTSKSNVLLQYPYI